MRYSIVLFLFLARIAATAQVEISSIRSEKGGGDTIFIINRAERVFPDGTRVVEEVWKPQNDSSLLVYLVNQEKVINIEVEALRERQKRQEDKSKEIKRLISERKSGGGGKKKSQFRPSKN
jgi:hypothetical protein